jgi:hypothetical protein
VPHTLDPSTLYPFERFTEDAKRTLTLAQQEAERSRNSYIGTEHLLLGLLRHESGTAHMALSDLGIEIEKVREIIATVIGRSERVIIQQIIPTSRVKTVIEIAFDEAREMGRHEVDSGHLLMALVIEGEGIAARVLADLGAGEKEVIAAVEHAMGVPHRERPRRKRPKPPQPPFPARQVLVPATQTIAIAGEQLPAESDLVVLHRLLRAPRIADLLRAKGLADVNELLAELGNPPDAVVKLRGQVQNLRTNLTVASSQQRFDEAARLQKQLTDLMKKLDRAELEWLRKLTA